MCPDILELNLFNPSPDIWVIGPITRGPIEFPDSELSPFKNIRYISLEHVDPGRAM